MKVIEFQHNNQTILLSKLKGNEEVFIALHKWLTDPKILEFYEGRDKDFNLNNIKDGYGSKITSTKITPCLILVNNIPIGYLQYYKLLESGEYSTQEYCVEYEDNTYAIDLFIGETEYWGQGIGSAILQNLIEYLYDQLDAENIYIDPKVDNTRAIRAYEKAGFRKVRILKNHEIFEGEQCDFWLMKHIK